MLCFVIKYFLSFAPQNVQYFFILSNMNVYQLFVLFCCVYIYGAVFDQSTALYDQTDFLSIKTSHAFYTKHLTLFRCGFLVMS